MNTTSKPSFRRRAVTIAVSLAIAVAMPVTATAANVDNISGTQDYQNSDASGNPYTLYDFTGTSSPNVLQFGSSSGYGPEIDNAIVLPGVENNSTSSAVSNGEIEWQAGGQPRNRLAIANINLQTGAVESPVPGNGTLSIITVPFSGSNPQNYLNLILAGNQSLGAANLNFDGWGRISFGSKSWAIGDTQSLRQLQMNSDFSGILDFYKANTTIGTVLFGGNGFFTSTGGVSTVNLGQVYSPGGVSFGSLTPAGASITFNVGGVQAKFITIGGSAPGSVTYNLHAGSIDLGGAGTAILDASAVNFGEVGVNGNVYLYGGNLTVSPSTMGLQIAGDYKQTGGNLTLDITPSGNRGFIGTGGTYQITGGNVIVSGETGTYSNGQTYELLESLTTGNTYNPGATYYVYNGASGSTIDGLKAYLGQITAGGQQHVELCLGSSCASSPSQPAPAPAPVPVPTKITPIKVVTPVGEAKPILAHATAITQQQAMEISGNLLSTGIVGGGPVGLWGKPFGGVSSDGGANGFNYGLLFGYGQAFDHNKAVFGGAFTYSHGAIGQNASNSAVQNAYGLWAYGDYFPNPRWKITGTLGGGWTNNRVFSSPLGVSENGVFNGNFFDAAARASYWRNIDGLIVSPRMTLAYLQTSDGAYSTTGFQPLGVQVGAQTSGQFQITPAVLIGKNYKVGSHTLFPQVRLGVQETIGPRPATTIASLNGKQNGTLQGLPLPHTQGMAEVRLDVFNGNLRDERGLAGNVAVKQLFGGGASSTEFMATVKYRW
jgi:hypothetical protein